jgi:hypothetical protein
MSIGHFRGDAIEYNGVNLPVKYAVVNIAASGDIIAAVAAKHIVLVSAALAAAGTVTLTMNTGTGPTARTGPMTMIAGVPLVLPLNPAGWVRGGSGEKLTFTLGGAVQVSGVVGYVELPE